MLYLLEFSNDRLQASPQARTSDNDGICQEDEVGLYQRASCNSEGCDLRTGEQNGVALRKIDIPKTESVTGDCQRVGTRLEVDNCVCCRVAAIKDDKVISSSTTGENVATPTEGNEGVVAGVTEEAIVQPVCGAQNKDVIPCPTREAIAARALERNQRIRAFAAKDNVTAARDCDGVRAAASDNYVVAGGFFINAFRKG